MQKINTPLQKKQIGLLSAGEEISLTGVIYAARDQAHKRLIEALKQGKKLPINLKGAVIYYCGPAKTPPGKIIGACGPTTSSRMDEFTPVLLKAGVRAMIGKGERSGEVAAAIKRHKAVYFLTYAGCAALLARLVKKVKVVAYRDLGPEAVLRLEVKDFPLITAIDAKGKDIYAKKRRQGRG
jgi:fumarate hydratase subunit beta